MEFIMKSFLPLLIVCLLIICLTVNAQIPKKISYQGMLTTSSGTPVQDGSYSFQFKLYSTVSGGTPLWIETQVGVPVGRGVFNVFLGSVTPFNVSFNMPLFLEVITIGGPGISEPLTMLPRSEFTSSPYAMWADTASYAIVTVPTGNAGGDLTGSFPNPTIKDSSITSAKILDSTIQREDVQPTFKAPYADTADYARVLSDTGAYLPIAGGVMKGAITNIGDPSITMGKGNFGSGNINTGDYAFVSGFNNQAIGKYSVVSGGGPGNIANDTSATVGGGSYNSALGEYATIGGGKSNLIPKFPTNPSYSTIGGGVNNVIKHVRATIGGGENNVIDDNGALATISGGSGNYANGWVATIGGGSNNIVDAGSTISGGNGNSAYSWSTISGGMNNNASFSGAIGGGGSNNATQQSTISGGFNNYAGGSYSTIGGGRNNKATGQFSFIGGGGGIQADSNSALGAYSVIVGGRGNKANDTSATVGGGSYNSASSEYATIGGGLGNIVNDSGAVISGGRRNFVAIIDGTIGGGSGNSLGADGYTSFQTVGSTIGGGVNNKIYSTGSLKKISPIPFPSSWSTISGGKDNMITANDGGNTIGGGQGNYISIGLQSTIGGGTNNKTVGEIATVGGGRNNTAGYTNGYSYYTVGSTVGGGESNVALSYYGTVSGGKENFAGHSIAFASTVGGGALDTALSYYSTVPGGLKNKASGDYSFAAGRRAKALNEGSFVWGDATDADFPSERDNQFRIRANGGARFDVNNNNWVNIWDDGTNLINTSTNARLTLAGVWQSVSDRNQKENIIEVNSKEILKKLMQLPISLWNYKVEGDKIKHIGPMAQDFYSVFGVGSDDKTISSIDPAGVAFAAIQELSKQNEELKSQNEEINTRLNELETLVKSIVAAKQSENDKPIGELR
jgi:hypothetical protein